MRQEKRVKKTTTSVSEQGKEREREKLLQINEITGMFRFFHGFLN